MGGGGENRKTRLSALYKSIVSNHKHTEKCYYMYVHTMLYMCYLLTSVDKLVKLFGQVVKLFVIYHYYTTQTQVSW